MKGWQEQGRVIPEPVLILKQLSSGIYKKSDFFPNYHINLHVFNVRQRPRKVQLQH